MQELWRFHRQIDRNCGVLLTLFVLTEGDLLIWMVGCWCVKWHGVIDFPSLPAVMLASVLGLYGEVQLSPIRACSFFVTQSGLMGPRNTIRQGLVQRPVKSGPDSHSGLHTGHAFLLSLKTRSSQLLRSSEAWLCSVEQLCLQFSSSSISDTEIEGGSSCNVFSSAMVLLLMS